MEISGRTVHFKVAEGDHEDAVKTVAKFWLQKCVGTTTADYRRHAEKILKEKKQ